MFSVVKMMKEQGNQFDWSQIAIDIPSLPCFKPEAEWPWEKVLALEAELGDILAEGYAAVDGFIVRVTGENPGVSSGDVGAPVFVDCEPVVIDECKVALNSFDSLTDASELSLTPIRLIHLDSSGQLSNLTEQFGVRPPAVGSDISAITYCEGYGEAGVILKTVVGIFEEEAG